MGFVQMTPECVALLLKGRVARAGRYGEDPLSFAINRTVHALLDGVKDNREDRRLKLLVHLVRYCSLQHEASANTRALKDGNRGI